LIPRPLAVTIHAIDTVVGTDYLSESLDPGEIRSDDPRQA